jgi:hypothetical protein
VFYSALTGSENPFKYTITDLPRPNGGIYGKYYSLPSLKDPRIGIDFGESLLWVFIFEDCKLVRH